MVISINAIVERYCLDDEDFLAPIVDNSTILVSIYNIRHQMSFYIVICKMAKLEIALHTVRLSISELNVFDMDFLFCMYFTFPFILLRNSVVVTICIDSLELSFP